MSIKDTLYYAEQWQHFSFVSSVTIMLL